MGIAKIGEVSGRGGHAGMVAISLGFPEPTCSPEALVSLAA